MKLIGLLILTQLISQLPKGSSQTQVSCGSNDGADYYCSQGLTCCQYSECCTSLQFCSGIAQGICIDYLQVTVLPATLCFMFVACFLNYKHKRNFLNDVESFDKLQKECLKAGIVKDEIENTKQLIASQEEQELNKQSNEDLLLNNQCLVDNVQFSKISLNQSFKSIYDHDDVEVDDQYDKTKLKNRNSSIKKDDKCQMEDGEDRTADLLFKYKKMS